MKICWRCEYTIYHIQIMIYIHCIYAFSKGLCIVYMAIGTAWLKYPLYIASCFSKSEKIHGTTFIVSPQTIYYTLSFKLSERWPCGRVLRRQNILLAPIWVIQGQTEVHKTYNMYADWMSPAGTSTNPNWGMTL